MLPCVFECQCLDPAGKYVDSDSRAGDRIRTVTEDREDVIPAHDDLNHVDDRIDRRLRCPRVGIRVDASPSHMGNAARIIIQANAIDGKNAHTCLLSIGNHVRLAVALLVPPTLMAASGILACACRHTKALR
ncbi:hypothetical protein GCM10027419_26960 [Pandoraea terrae]